MVLNFSSPASHSTVIEGMDVVYKIEALGSQSGQPSKKVTIAKSGEVTGDEDNSTLASEL